MRFKRERGVGRRNSEHYDCKLYIIINVCVQKFNLRILFNYFSCFIFRLQKMAKARYPKDFRSALNLQRLLQRIFVHKAVSINVLKQM